MQPLVTTLGFCLLISSASQAASVSIPAMLTEQIDPAGIEIANTPSAIIALDLSSPVGLVAGMPIQLTYSADAPIWAYSFTAFTGTLETIGKITYEFIIGSTTFSFTDEWEVFGPELIDLTDGSPDVLGYATGPIPSKTFTVPWGTNLDDIHFRIIDQSSFFFDGVGKRTDSYMYSIGGTLSTSSIPEPSTSLLAIVAATFAIGSRRRK